MTEAEQIAEDVGRVLPNVKSGMLRFWGQWFGRPYDNWHRIVSANGHGDVLQLHFNEGEVLSIWTPRGATIDEKTFRITDASLVRWEWFYYGRPKTVDNLYFEEFVKDGRCVSASTNINFNWGKSNLSPDVSQPAVEML